jgi:hypothetical protein
VADLDAGRDLREPVDQAVQAEQQREGNRADAGAGEEQDAERDGRQPGQDEQGARARGLPPLESRIPTMTARMPSRINEVDVDLNRKGIPFRVAQLHHVLRKARGAGQHQETRRPRMPANILRLWGYSRCPRINELGL